MKSKCFDCIHHLTYAAGSVCDKQILSFPVVHHCMFYESNESETKDKMSYPLKLVHKKEKEKPKEKKPIEQEYVSTADKTKYVFYSYLPQRGEE